MDITTHFTREEFELDGPMPDGCLPAFLGLCTTLLEPIRSRFAGPIVITSGYRSPSANAAAHGVPGSEHIATEQHCAADWKFRGGIAMREVFDWIRTNPALAWGQVILEHGPAGDVIHLSWERDAPRREAFEGDTANRAPYQAWAVAPLETGNAGNVVA